ncbi:MAG: AAA family ATPase, partial [Anaerolineales bacterium]
MIPYEIRLENFLAYRHPEPLRLEGIHVACLAGPNGAGKSSLLDAITWCLWGKARTNSADDLIHQGESVMAVTLIFGQGGNRYQVIRQRKAGKRGSSLLEFQIRDEKAEVWRPLSEGTIRETQERIDELLRLDYDTFVNSAFLVQGRADEFTTKTPGQRKEVLSSILGLDRWQEYEARAKDEARELQGEMDRIEGRLQELELELEQREQYKEALAKAEGEARVVSEKLSKAEDEWTSLEQSRKDLVRLQRQIDDFTRRIVSRQREVAEAAEELKALEAKSDQNAIEAALAEIRESVSAYGPLEEQKSKLEAEKAALAEEAANLRGINQALGPETEPLKERAQTLRAATEPICPTCGQALTEEHREELLMELQAQVERRRQDYRQNREQIQMLEEKLHEVGEKLVEVNDKLRGRPQAEKRLGELEAAMSHAAEAARQAESMKAKIDRWQKALKQEEEQREAVEKEALETEQTLEAASLTQSDIDNLRRQKRLADERVGGARQQLAALEQIEEQAEKSRQRRQALAYELSLLEELREAFSKRGVPAMIIETVVPELERTANELLARMTDGRFHVRIETQREIKTGELREALDIIISDELGSRPYELYSG